MMRDVAEFLIEHYYTKYEKVMSYIPTLETLEDILNMNMHRVITIREKGKLVGAAMFLELEDKEYNNLEKIDIKNENVMSMLIKQKGRNAHFFLVAGTGVKNIRDGLRQLSNKYKTVSWWEPNRERLHRYKLKGE